MQAQDQQDKWWYLKPDQVEPVGPIPADELRFLFATDKISRRTLVWAQGMEQWVELGDIPSLQKTDRINPRQSVIARQPIPPSPETRAPGL